MKKYRFAIVVSVIIMIFSFLYYNTNFKKENNGNQILSSRMEAAQKEKHTIKVAWWSSQLRTDLTRRVIEIFEEEYPTIEIQMEFTDWNGYWDKLATQAATQSLPDVMQQDYKYIGRYTQKELLYPLDEFIQEGTIDLSSVNESIVQGGKIEGITYGISLGTNTQVLVYNQEIVKQAGVQIKEQMTWDEYDEICEQIYKKTGVQTVPVYRGDVLRGLELHVRNQGKSLYAQDQNSLGFEDPKIIEGYFERTKNLVEQGIIISPNKVTSVHEVSEGPLLTGLVWNEFQWSNQISLYTNISDKAYGITFIPQDKESVQYSQYLKPSMFFSIANSSKEKESAAIFIDYFTNSLEANEIMLGERGVPISYYIRDSITPLLDPVGMAIFDFVGKAESYSAPIDPPEPAAANEITQVAAVLLDQVWYGMITPQQAALQFMIRSNGILSKK